MKTWLGLLLILLAFLLLITGRNLLPKFIVYTVGALLVLWAVYLIYWHRPFDNKKVRTQKYIFDGKSLKPWGPLTRFSERQSYISTVD
jgi:hypothetical protein